MKHFLLFAFILLFIKSNAQILDCNGSDYDKLFIQLAGGNIYSYDPSLPQGPTNPLLLPSPPAGGGLAVGKNLNVPTPTWTFYTTMSTVYNYYDGAVWIPTGHTSAYVNPGGGHNAVYSKNGSSGWVDKYMGVANAANLVQTCGNCGPYDVAVDTFNNFYIIDVSQNNLGYITKYNPNGVIIDTIVLLNVAASSAGGGFAIVGCTVHIYTSNYMFGQIVNDTAVMVQSSLPITAISDFASCPTRGCSIPAPPVADFSFKDTVCAGECINFVNTSLNSPTVTNWTFNGASILSSTSYNPAGVCFNTPGTFNITLIVSNTLGADTIVKQILVKPQPIVSISGSNNICENTSTTLSSTGNYATIQYQWSSGQITPNITVSPSTTTVYTLVAAINGCYDTATHQVAVSPVPVASISGDNELCEGESTTLFAAPNGAYNYKWSNGSTAASITITPGSTANHSVVVSLSNCSDTAYYLVAVNPKPIVSVHTVSARCNQNNGLAIAQCVTGTPAFVYNWSNGAVDGTMQENLAAGNYSLYVVDSKGCKDSANFTISQLPMNPVSVSASSTSIIAGDSLTLTASGSNVYLWFPFYMLNSSTSPVIMAWPISSTNYCVKGTDVNGCLDTACVYVNVDTTCRVVFPTAFSPNNDNKNDYFFPICNCLRDFQLQVFNRYGNMVFSSGSDAIKWDGTYNGKALDADVYFYNFKGTTRAGKKVAHHGDITLLR